MEQIARVLRGVLLQTLDLQELAGGVVFEHDPGGDDMRTRTSRVGVRLGSVALALAALALLGGCASSPPAVASDRQRDESACVRSSIGLHDTGYYFTLPFDVDRDAYERCMEDRGYHLSHSGIQAP